MDAEIETRMVQGQQLVSIGRMAGHPMFAFTAQGVRYRLIPNVGNSYVLRREAGGYCGRFETLNDAVRFACTTTATDDDWQ